MKRIRIKKTLALILSIALLLTICACGASSDSKGTNESETENEVNETDAVDEPCTHSFENGTCTICGAKVIDIVGEFIKESPDSFSNGAYIKSFLHSDFGDVKADNEKEEFYSLGFALVEGSNTLIIQGMRDVKGGSDSISISINGGVIARVYEYLYSTTNKYLPDTYNTLQMKGNLNATALSSAETLDYNSTSGNESLIKVYFDNGTSSPPYTACTLAKKTILMFDELMEHYELGIKASDLNFK